MIFTLEPAVSAMPGIFSVRTCLPSSPLGQGPLVRLRHDGVFLKGHLTAHTQQMGRSRALRCNRTRVNTVISKGVREGQGANLCQARTTS